MVVNEGRTDRAARSVAGGAALIAALAVGASTPVGIALFVFAAIMAGSAASGFCPVYRAIGVRTNGPARNGNERRSSLVRR